MARVHPRNCHQTIAIRDSVLPQTIDKPYSYTMHDTTIFIRM